MKISSTISKSMVAAAVLSLGLVFSPVALAQSLDNNPTVDESAAANSINTQIPEEINPLWFILPIGVLAAIGLWLIRPTNHQTYQRHSPTTYNVIGAKGGEAAKSQHRTDNDVYADSLNDQEQRLRRIFDEPWPDDRRDH